MCLLSQTFSLFFNSPSKINSISNKIFINSPKSNKLLLKSQLKKINNPQTYNNLWLKSSRLLMIVEMN